MARRRRSSSRVSRSPGRSYSRSPRRRTASKLRRGRGSTRAPAIRLVIEHTTPSAVARPPELGTVTERPGKKARF